MTREQARQVEQQLSNRYPGAHVDVTRVFCGVEVMVSDRHGWVFMRTTDDSPLLALLGAAPDTEPGNLPALSHAAGDSPGVPVSGRTPARGGGPALSHHRSRLPLTFRNGTVIPGLVRRGGRRARMSALAPRGGAAVIRL